MSIISQVERKGQTAVGKTCAVPSRIVGNAEYQSPLLRLQIQLAGESLPMSNSAEIHNALQVLARFDRGEARELSGIAAWLDFLRAPYAEDQPLDAADVLGSEDTELSRTIGAALDWVVANPDEIPDSLAAMDRVIAEMEPHQVSRPQVVTLPARGAAPTLVFDQEAQPPFDKHDQLLRDNREFKRAWDHKLTHLPDQSTEAYDQVLANIASQAGWSDQEIVNLAIAHRRQQPLENANPGAAYFLAMLQRTKDGTRTASPADNRSTEDPARVRELIAGLNRALGINILKIVKYGGNDGTYELTLDDGRKVDLGTAGEVLNHRQTKAVIAGATTIVISSFKQPQWDKIASAIFKCAGPAPIEDAPEVQELCWWLRLCVRSTALIDIDERDRAGLARIIREREGSWAFRTHTGNLLIHLGGFMSAIHLKCGARPTWKECALRLRKVRFAPRDLEGKDGEGKPRINVWASPHGWELGA